MASPPRGSDEASEAAFPGELTSEVSVLVPLADKFPELTEWPDTSPSASDWVPDDRPRQRSVPWGIDDIQDIGLDVLETTGIRGLGIEGRPPLMSQYRSPRMQLVHDALPLACDSLVCKHLRATGTDFQIAKEGVENGVTKSSQKDAPLSLPDEVNLILKTHEGKLQDLLEELRVQVDRVQMLGFLGGPSIRQHESIYQPRAEAPHSDRTADSEEAMINSVDAVVGLMTRTSEEAMDLICAEEGDVSDKSSNCWARQRSKTTRWWKDDENVTREDMEVLSIWRPSSIFSRDNLKIFSTRMRQTFVDRIAGYQPNNRKLLSRIVLHKGFDWFSFLIIVVNSLFIGYTLELRIRYLWQKDTLLMQGADLSFQCWYVIEVALKLYVHRVFFFLGKDRRWNMFDLFLVLASVYDQIAMFIARGAVMFTEDNKGNEDGGGNNILLMRMLRVLRMARILRMLRVMRFFRELRLMLFSIVGSMRSLFWCFVLLALIIYVAALIFVQASISALMDDEAVDSHDAIRLHWGSVVTSMETLFQSTTGGLDWGDAAGVFKTIPTALSDMYYYLFMLYIGFTYFAVLNILTGIFVDNAIKHSSDDREHVVMEHLLKEQNFVKGMKDVFHQMDSDGSGAITLQEFMSEIDNPKIIRYLEALELSIQDAELFFRMLAEVAGGEVDVDTFVDGCIRVKGLAKGVDLQTLAFETKQMDRRQTRFQAYCRLQFEELLLASGCGGQSLNSRQLEQAGFPATHRAERSA